MCRRRRPTATRCSEIHGRRRGGERRTLSNKTGVHISARNSTAGDKGPRIISAPMAVRRLFPLSFLRLGPLERRVLEVMWQRPEPASVRGVLNWFPHLAYTTLMTTLDRLHGKGLLDRTKSGRAFLYHPRLQRDEMARAVAQRTVRSVIAEDQAALRPLVSFLIESIDARDTELLDELEELVRNRRSSGPRRKS
jgi:predicted transcriptional regulator